MDTVSTFFAYLWSFLNKKQHKPGPPSWGKALYTSLSLGASLSALALVLFAASSLLPLPLCMCMLPVVPTLSSVGAVVLA